MRLVTIYTKIKAISLASMENKIDKFFLTINTVFVVGRAQALFRC